VAWQVEHEPVDPLGFEHSWRLDTSFVQHEIAAVRQADSSRPVLINAYLPASTLAGVTQWWRTRDQGDSLALALRAADIVGLDHYPRHALVGVGGWTVYLDGNGQWFKRALAEVFSRARRVMVTEAQAEPWEAVTVPPNPRGWTAYSCPPEQIVGNYNAWMRWAHAAGVSLEAYLFWGAEYWVLRQLSGDPSYLETFERILARS
jgi:hypothetical protein